MVISILEILLSKVPVDSLPHFSIELFVFFYFIYIFYMWIHFHLSATTYTHKYLFIVCGLYFNYLIVKFYWM